MASQHSNVATLTEVGTVEWIMQQDARAMLRMRAAIGAPIKRTVQEQVAVLRKGYEHYVQMGREAAWLEVMLLRIARNRAKLADLEAPAGCNVVPFRRREG